MVRSSWCEKEGRFKNVTKNGSYRRVEMNDDVRDILLSYRHLPGNKPIFRAIMRSHTVKKFSELTLKAGVRPLHFHGLRHTFLTNMANGTRLAAPIPLPKVMELAGHSSIETTMIYVHSAGIAGTSSGQMSRADIKRQKLHLVASDAKEA
jgi:integrase